jgi:DNA-binding LacI/PurR family transcriptional regulator
VDNNNIIAAEAVTKYLVSFGHEKILFLNAPKFRTICLDREQGCINTVEDAAKVVDTRLIISTDEGLTSIEFGYTTTKLMLKSRSDITAIITDTDKIALGVSRAAAEVGRSIPNDLSIVAFSDDSVYAPEFSPPLSSVRLNGEMLGCKAAKLLVDQLDSNKSLVKRVVVPTEFLLRDSCEEGKRE